MVFPIHVDWLSHRFSSSELEPKKGISLISPNYIYLNKHILKVRFPGAKDWEIIDASGENILFANQIDGVDILDPQGMPISKYYEYKKRYSLREEMRELFLAATEKEEKKRRTEKLELIGADIAGQRVSLQVSGNVNINGRLQNQKRSQVRSGFREGQSTTFLIDQKQQLNIEGKIGDKISVLVDQDSERDFDFENALKIIYKGQEDDIVQKVEAGNVALSLPGTQFVTFSGKNNGLFGLKAIMKLGGLDVTTIASVEKGKKEKLSVDGGAQATNTSIKDYEYRRSLYFFLHKDFRSTFYEGFFESGGRFTFDPNKVVTDLEVYKSIAIEEPGSIPGKAYVDPADTNAYPDYIEQRIFKRLELNKEYYADLNLGYIRMATQVQESEIIGVVYRITDQTENTIEEYGDWDRSEFDTTNIVLKLIKPEQMIPSNPCWDLEFKNVYSLGATGINPEGFDLKIVYVHGETGDEDRAKEDGETFLQKFGLDSKDQNGNLVPDDILDIDNGAIINLQLGELWLPFLRPFQYRENDNSGERNPNLSDNYNCSAMYDSTKTMYSEITADSKFKIVYKYENRSSTISLGPMVIEGSESVTLGNQTLTRGVDYTIDYFSGTLTILRQDALNPDASIDIKYEKIQFFQLDKKTILGTRAQYDFGENSYIGGTALYFSKSVIDEKVDVGYEPIRNFVWDLNSRFSRKLDFLTRAVDWLPLIRTDQQSSISFEGEIAQVLPNPNTISNKETGDPDGVGFIDDFEGAKRITSPPIMRRYWSLASVPLDDNGELKDESQRGFTFWFNPFGGIPTKNIWPNKEVSVRAQNNITEVLIMAMDPEWATSIGVGTDPEIAKRAWGGITYFFPTSYYDQSKTKFLEVWIKGNSGHLHIDLGQISEEVVLDNKLSTEDKPEAGFTTGNDLLDLPDEDTGIDGVFDGGEFIITDKYGENDPLVYQDPRLSEYKRSPTDPHSDNWNWKEGSTNYRYINGTEGNSKDVYGLYPDTEDMNNNYVLDRVNDYYTVDFYLDEEDNDYIAGRTLKTNGKPTGWKLYRVPLPDFQKAKSGGDVTWQTIRACRLWFDGAASEDSIWIAKIEMVGNEWEELGIAEDENADYIKKEGEFAVTVINTEDNPDIYDAPKGVQGEYDRINELRMKEQSLVLSLEGAEGLKPGELCAAKKVLFEEYSFITYKKMKLFINGHDLRTRSYIYSEGEKTPLQFFIRFGRGGQNPQYYEYRQPVYPGWDKRNKMEIDLDFITRLKSYNSEEDYPNKDVRPKEYRITRNEAGEIIKRHYREVVDGKYTGEEVIICGSPALSRIQQIEVGLKNQKYALDDYNQTSPRNRWDNSIYGQVWLDELRLSEVRRDPGVAYRSKASLKIADLANINISINRKDADFHTVEQRPSLKASGLNTSRNLRAQGSLSLHKFAPNKWGLKIPISGSYSENVSTPKFIPGTDILSGDTPPDSILTISQSYGFNTSFSKSPSDFWLTKYTIDQISTGFNAQWKNNSSVNVRESKSENYSGKFSYKIPFGRDNYFQPLKWMLGIPILGSKFGELRWYYTPSKLEFSMDVSESKSSNIPRVGEPKKPNYNMGLNRNFSFGYKVFDNLNFTYTKGMKNDMDEFRGEKLRALTEWKAGIPVNVRENFSASFSPKIFSWLKPSVNYSSNYGWSEPLGSATKSIDQLSSQNRMSTSFSLNLASIMESFYTPKSGKSRTTSGRGGGRRSGAPKPSSPKSSPKEKKPVKEIKVLELFHKYLKKMQTIQVSYSVNQSIRSNGRMGSPSVLYRLGFQDDPGLEFNSGEVPENNKDNLSKNVDFSMRSGLSILPNISTSLSFSQNMARTLSQGQEGKNMTRDFFPLGENGKNGIPFPGWTVRWSQLEKIKFLSKFCKTLSLDHGFSGKETSVFRNDEETNSSYKMYFQPLLGVSVQFKNNINSTIRVTEGKTVNNRQSGTEIVNDRNISSTINYQRRGGMTIPLPFLKNLNLENNISFSLSFDYNESKTRQRNTEGSKFTVSQENKTWKVSPKINYSFTKKVTGGIFYTYGESFNRRTGKRITRNGGFDINIAIRG